MKTRVSRNEEAPVLLRVTINGLRAETTTNLKVNPDLWHNSALGKALGTNNLKCTKEFLLDNLLFVNALCLIDK